MNDEKVIALEMALKAVLSTAREQGIDVEHLSEAAIDGLLKYEAYKSQHLTDAANQIERTICALEHQWSAAG
ncbi:hypothetical protein ABQX22_13510 [Xanthomonas sp. WHRI 1810A]|uniref:hypothetical protein n=1 Tax=Xanthomonas sp. WHRI 1810A TaxID=3161565 RepID=UPI0032E8D04C